MLRTLGALGLVLGMLATALWVVRRYDLKLPGRITGGGGRRRIELVERLMVDGKRSVALIRRDGFEHLILIGPEGHVTLETGITAPPASPAPEQSAPARVQADMEAIKAGMARLAALPRQFDFAKMLAGVQAREAGEPAAAPRQAPADDPALYRSANDTDPFMLEAETAAAPQPRTRAPRDTTRWNKRAVREALDG